MAKGFSSYRLFLSVDLFHAPHSDEFLKYTYNADHSICIAFFINKTNKKNTNALTKK